MKIVILIGRPKPPLVYLVNAINRCHKIDLLIIEDTKMKIQKKNNNFRGFIEKNITNNKYNFSFYEKVLRYMLAKSLDKKKSKIRQAEQVKTNKEYQKIFKNEHKSIDQGIKTIYVTDINSTESELAIKEVNPELLIDHGTKLLKDNIIDSTKIALNLHWGLSPYYRGVDCTKRAIFNWDLNNIGVTIHKLSKNIDGGDILGQERVDVLQSDNESTINAKMTYLGVEILKKAIEKTLNGEQLIYKKQDFRVGYLFKISNMNNNLNTFMENLDEETLKKMIKKPSRSQAPIISI